MKRLLRTTLSLACVLLAPLAARAADAPAAPATNAVSMTPPQANKVKVCTVRPNFLKQTELKEYKLDLSKVPQPFQNEIKFYTVNALHSVGLKETAASDLVVAVEVIDSHLNIVSANPRKERKSVQITITATEKGTMIWTVTSACSGRASEVSNFWFPGLIASILPNFGQNRGGPLAIGKYPVYLNAVNTPPPAK